MQSILRSLAISNDNELLPLAGGPVKTIIFIQIPHIFKIIPSYEIIYPNSFPLITASS